MIMNEEKIFMAGWFLFPFFAGGYYEYACCLYSIFLIFLLWKKIKKQQKVEYSVNKTFLFWPVLYICYLCTCLWGIDRNMTFFSSFRYLTVIIAVISWIQCSGEEKEKIFQTIPYSATAMVLMCIWNKKQCYDAYGNFYGTFGYKNSFAMFLALAIWIELYYLEKNKKSKKQLLLGIIKICVCAVGVVAANSKSVLILLVSGILLKAILWGCHKMRKTVFFILLSIGMILIGILLLTWGKKLGGIESLLNYLQTSHSLNERFVFYYDGWKLFLNNPWGLGMHGFYYSQPAIQSGYYYSVNVHNDLIQMGIEAGVVPMIYIIVCIFASLLSKNNGKLQKQLLVFISIHALFDFDLQFMYLLVVLAMCFDYGKLKSFTITENPMIKVWKNVILCLNMHIFITGLFLAKGYNEIVVNLYPHTSAQVLILAETTSQQEGVDLAKKILSHNEKIFEAELALARIYGLNAMWEEAFIHMDKAIELNPRDMGYYEEFAELYYSAASFYYEQEQYEQVKECCRKILSVTDKVQNVKQSTLPEAYRMMWEQDFSLTSETQSYIKKAEEMLASIIN